MGRENRVQEVGEVVRGMKSIAKDLDCTVVGLCQLNRRVEGADEKQPRLDDLRESGHIEQESDSVLFLWTDERDTQQAMLPMYITLAKHRHGPTAKIAVTFDKARRRFLPA
jgi:replicative DNA helicase